MTLTPTDDYVDEVLHDLEAVVRWNAANNRLFVHHLVDAHSDMHPVAAMDRLHLLAELAERDTDTRPGCPNAARCYRDAAYWISTGGTNR